MIPFSAPRRTETPRNYQPAIPSLLDPRDDEFLILDDEIKPEVGRLLVTGHGSLVVPAHYTTTLFTSMQMERGNYDGRLHFTDLGERGPRADVARSWVDSFFRTHIQYVSFKGTFALHDGPLPLPYPGDDGFARHWVHSTSSNLLGHLRYTLAGRDSIVVRPVFDGTDLASERAQDSEAVVTTQFRMNERRRQGKSKYPHTLISPPTFQSSDHRLAASLDEAINANFLQLVDLLLGATSQALNYRTVEGKQGRRVLARRITEEMALRVGSPEWVFSRFLRHFSVSLYPDARGRMYAATTEKRVPGRSGQQLRLAI